MILRHVNFAPFYLRSEDLHFADSLRLLELSLITLAEHLSLLSTIISFSTPCIGLIQSAGDVHFEVHIFKVVQAELSWIAAVLEDTRSDGLATASCGYTLLRLQGRCRRLQERRRSDHLSRRNSAWNWQCRAISTVHCSWARIPNTSRGSLDHIELRLYVFIEVCIVDSTALSTHATSINHLPWLIDHGIKIWQGDELLLLESTSISVLFLVQLRVADNIDVRWWVRAADMRARVATTVLLRLNISLIYVLLLVLCGRSLGYHSR